MHTYRHSQALTKQMYHRQRKSSKHAALADGEACGDGSTEFIFIQHQKLKRQGKKKGWRKHRDTERQTQVAGRRNTAQQSVLKM